MDSICRLCMCKENLTSIWGKADGEKINEKIHFLCGVIVTASDQLPKFICHLCLSQVIIGSQIKRKSLETEKTLLNELLEDEMVELNEENDDNPNDDPFFYTNARESLGNKFLVYEENTEDEDQPKINFEITDSTIRMKNVKNIENPELKLFLDGYLSGNKKSNMEIIKVTSPENINEIEKVIFANNELKRLRKRPRDEIVISAVHSEKSFNIKQQQQRSPKEIMQESRLLSALSGHRMSNSNLNRMYSNNSNRN